MSSSRLTHVTIVDNGRTEEITLTGRDYYTVRGAERKINRDRKAQGLPTITVERISRMFRTV